MEKTLTMPSPQRSRAPSVLESLIEEWIPKLAINAGAALDARTQAVFKALWLEGLDDMSPDVLRAAFLKTLRECAYWPVKVADIRKHITHAKETAELLSAQKAWEMALDFRRRHWRPDLRGQRPSYAPTLPHRIEQSMRTAGVLQDYDDPDQLHVWVKKNFIEYYLAYSEMEESGKFLLPEGELLDTLRAIGEPKTLPAAPTNFDDLHKRGREYVESVKQGELEQPMRSLAKMGPRFQFAPIADIAARKVKLERQRKIIMEKFGEAKALPGA